MIFSHMRPRDASAEAQQLMDAHYLGMTPAEKANVVRQAWVSARGLVLAGLRLDFSTESEEGLEGRWAERRLAAR
ncbi:MAG: hypothetical protein ACI841_005439 [Planctomycetota bacterium]|jgi:hypothetical protein